MSEDQPVLLVVDDPVLKQELLRELAMRRPLRKGALSRGHYQVSIAGNPGEALHRLSNGSMPRRSGATPVIVLDEVTLCASLADWPTITDCVSVLTEKAPVILLLDPQRAERGPAMPSNGLATLIAGGRLEIVPRDASFLALLMALLERHAAAGGPESEANSWESFGEILRHELNNPLTGILGNAELLLARRDRFPPADVERLKTIAEMAVRLRETVRRLSNAWDGCAVGPVEQEVRLKG